MASGLTSFWLASESFLVSSQNVSKLIACGQQYFSGPSLILCALGYEIDYSVRIPSFFFLVETNIRDTNLGSKNVYHTISVEN